MKDYKSAALLAASTATRALLALYTVKITAVTLGLSGIGIIGQFNNLLLIVTMIAGGGIASGIVNVATKVDSSSDDIKVRLSSAHGYGLLFASVLLLLVFTFRVPLAQNFLPIEHGEILFVALAGGHFVLFHVAALSALLNSYQRQDLFAMSSLCAGVVGAAAVTIGCVNFGMTGALCGILVGSLSQWVFLYWGARSAIPLLALLGRPKLVPADLRFWWRFTALSFVTVIGMPFAQIVVRNALADSAGWDAVGVWQAMLRLSDAYMQFGLLYLSAFYFPRLAAAKTIDASLDVILDYARRILPAMLVVCIGIYLCRRFVVPLLFTTKFIGVSDLFLPQLIGDLFKIASYLITYAFLTTSHYKLSMAGEFTQALLFWLFASQFGLPYEAAGVAWSYTATYILYFVIVLASFRWILGRSKQPIHDSNVI